MVEGGGGHQQVERVLDEIVGEHREEAPAAEDVLRLEEAALFELLRDVLEGLALRDLAEQDLRRLPRARECIRWWRACAGGDLTNDSFWVYRPARLNREK